MNFKIMKQRELINFELLKPNLKRNSKKKAVLHVLLSVQGRLRLLLLMHLANSRTFDVDLDIYF